MGVFPLANGAASNDIAAEVNAVIARTAAPEAERILRGGDPFDYFLKTFQLDHEGDLTPARVMALTFAASAVVNGDGLHTYLSGNSGRGKSHAAETMMRQLPDGFRYNRSFSDKHLYYAGKSGSLKEGAVIMVDDQTMSPQIQELFKVAVSSFRDGVKYGTVVNQKDVELEMPARVSWILLKVDDPGDDQVMNRLIQARIDESDAKIRASALMIQKKYCGLQKKNVLKERREIEVCREMWSAIKLSPVAVEVPCAGFVKFMDYHNLRNHELFFNLLMAHTAIHQYQRETSGTTADGESIIRANYADYKEAKYIFEALYSFGGQRYNTIKSEDQIVTALLAMELGEEHEFTIKDLCAVTGLTDTECRRALNGRRGKDGNLLGGLISKCPHVVRVGNRADHETASMFNQRGQYEISSRRSWNQEIYRVNVQGLELWKFRGGIEPVWVDGFDWSDE